jgi:hypothetical protein
MKYFVSQYWKIALGLASIFIGGLGFGGVLESLRHRQTVGLPEAASVGEDWIESTLTNLDRSLSLTDAQKLRIRPEIEAAAHEIEMSREGALLKFEISLLKFHRAIAPALDPAQRDELNRSEKSLETQIQQRTERLLGSETEVSPE